MAEYKGYVAEIAENEKTHLFQGQVIDIKDVVIFEADTLEKAKQEFEKSIDIYLAFCQKINKIPDA